MINKTKNYDKFKFRDDNRVSIDSLHINKLIESIKSRNLLEFRPIIVNENMEIIDGQHRLLAAKSLDLDIYYQIQKGLGGAEIILMNTSKNWINSDYLNYYCKNRFPEYLKLEEFMKKNNLKLHVALNICVGASRTAFNQFKNGKFVFKLDLLENEIEICWETINYIKKMNGNSPYTVTGRFWRSLIMLTTHHNFEKKKWFTSLPRMIERFSAKATTKDYCKLMMEVYNWRNSERINILEEEF